MTHCAFQANVSSLQKPKLKKNTKVTQANIPKKRSLSFSSKQNNTAKEQVCVKWIGASVSPEERRSEKQQETLI